MVKLITIVFSIVILRLQVCLGKGYVEITLRQLHNPDHFESGRECCDVWPWSKCRGQCDTELHLCVTGFGQPSSRISCNVAKVTTKVFSGMSSIDFKIGQDLGNGLINPMKFAFEKWQKFLEVMFTTYDNDTWPNRDDLIDIYSDIILATPAANSTIAKERSIEITGRVSTLKFDVKVYCDNKYEGDSCEVAKAS